MQACERYCPRKADGSFYSKSALPPAAEGKWPAVIPLRAVLCYTLYYGAPVAAAAGYTVVPQAVLRSATE